VHRDIKGDNILLTNEGEVKLADYGFAKPLKNSSDRLSYRIGSPSWMAPEVAACEIKSNKGYSIQADVWSVGITAIELAEGRAPY
ncbi:GSCOCG00012002001-RA-CDS, partial [Cotesia congregata]